MTRFTQAQLQTLIEQLDERFALSVGGNTSVSPVIYGAEPRLMELIRQRREHFHNRPPKNPEMGEKWQGHTFYQSVLPRIIHQKLRSRLTENHFKSIVSPARDTPTQKALANKGENVFNEMLTNLEDELGFSIQAALADGQIIDGLSVLHWRKRTEILPEMPEHEELEELPEDAAEAKRYTEDEYGEPLGKSKKQKYRETDDSLQQRYAYMCARAGSPWHVEVVDVMSCRWAMDVRGLAMMAVIRAVPLLQYNEDRAQQPPGAEGGRSLLSLNEQDSSIQVYRERDMPADWAVTDSNRMVLVCQLWTRDRFYELVGSQTWQGSFGTYGSVSWRLVDDFEHPYERLPFALCAGLEINDPDPAFRYVPALDNLFKLKPFHDRRMALLDAISEENALRYFYLQDKATELPMLNPDTVDILLSRNSMEAERIPAGYELKWIDYVVQPGLFQFAQMAAEEFANAAPPTGMAEITATTQPWAARLAQAQESVFPQMLLDNQVKALRTMVRNMAHVMSKSVEDGGTGRVDVFSRTEKGAIVPGETVSLEPEDVRSLDIDVQILGTTAAERVTRTQVGRELLNDPKAMLPWQDYIEDYEGLPESDSRKVRYYAEAMEKIVLGGLVFQKVAQWGGTKIALGANGEFVGPDGRAVKPMDVLARNGIVLPPEMMAMMGPAAGAQGQTGVNGAGVTAGAQGGMGATMPAQMPGLSGLQAPNTMPLRGLPG